MRKKIFVLDTSLFVNPDSARAFGDSPTHALKNFLERAQNTPDFEFLMPPSVFAELMNFAEENQIPHKLILLLHKKPPKKHEIRIPGFFLYKLVSEMRDRFDRSLRLAEKSVREAMDSSFPSDKPSGEFDKIRPDAEAIGRLRENFRRVTREGMLDSAEDVDLLLLAYETGGALVSCDQGVLHWAHELGILTVSHQHLSELLKG